VTRKRDQGANPEDTLTVTTAVKRAPTSARPVGEACLVCIYGADMGKRWPLRGGTMTIGRASSSDITLDQDSVSRAHAKITRRADSYVVRDLGSTNGTFVDDSAIKERVLADGDRIRVGRNIFKFLTGENIEAAYHDEIYRLVTVDGLTQIYNRRYFNEALDRELARFKRTPVPLSLLLIDLDHFKKTNDTHGHVTGDAVLRQLAAELTPRVERGQVLARTGGEEFGLIAPEADLARARGVGEAFRGAVMGAQFGLTTPIRCTISIGVAQYQPGETSDSFYKRADVALYRAKQCGRNRVEA
jgi:two-component system, cell cycle response regulator